jgi:hypothetical protein
MLFLAGTLSCLRLLAGEPAGGSAPIAVFMDFQSHPSPETVAQMQREIAAIMKPTGLAFDWRSIKDVRSGESFRELVVVKFKGRCETTGPSYDELGPLGKGRPLAYTRISDGHVLPFSDVECDTIRSYIGAKRDADLGTALGRVVAHELYHMLVRTTAHSETGVERAFHTRKDLTAEQFHFSPRESETLRALLRH